MGDGTGSLPAKYPAESYDGMTCAESESNKGVKPTAESFKKERADEFALLEEETTTALKLAKENTSAAIELVLLLVVFYIPPTTDDESETSDTSERPPSSDPKTPKVSNGTDGSLPA